MHTPEQLNESADHLERCATHDDMGLSMTLSQTADLLRWAAQRLALVEKKAHDWNAEADRYLAQRDALLVACQAVAAWLSSFSMSPTSTIAEKQEHLRLLEAAIKKAQAADAVDPPAGDPGNLSTREKDNHG